MVVKYEYNGRPPPQFVAVYGTFVIGIITSGIKNEKYSFPTKSSDPIHSMM
jgi:hypothetical protein